MVATWQLTHKKADPLLSSQRWAHLSGTLGACAYPRSTGRSQNRDGSEAEKR